jgi:hypothetical protein
MKLRRHALTLALAAAIGAWSCGGKAPTEATKDAAPAPTAVTPQGSESGDDVTASATGQSSMRWRFKDSCKDGKGIQARVFDKTGRSGNVFPVNGGTFKARNNGAVSKPILCRTGNKMCPGLTTAPQSKLFWGVGIDGDRRCDQCCRFCAPKTVFVEVSCPRSGPEEFVSRVTDDVLAAGDEGLEVSSDDEAEAAGSF